MIQFLTTVADQGVMEVLGQWLNTYVLPYLNTILITAVPALTPYITSRISAKFTAIKLSLEEKLSISKIETAEALQKVQTALTNITNIPNKVAEVVKPVFVQLDALTSILVIVADNSRIPDEQKQLVRSIAEAAKSADTFVDGLLKEKDEEIENLKRLVDEATLKLTIKSVEQEVKVIEKSKKKTKKTW